MTPSLAGESTQRLTVPRVLRPRTPNLGPRCGGGRAGLDPVSALIHMQTTSCPLSAARDRARAVRTLCTREIDQGCDARRTRAQPLHCSDSPRSATSSSIRGVRSSLRPVRNCRRTSACMVGT